MLFVVYASSDVGRKGNKMALIEFCDYNFGYPGSSEKAISNANLSIEEGEFVLVCGPSGCGKTTLIKQLLPAVSPYGTVEGGLFISGKRIEEIDDSELVTMFGYVGQNPINQMVTDKVWHELAFGMENLGLSQDVMERRIAEICEFFGMQSWLDRDVSTLSGGEMQMVHLASVMVMEPNVLILDEPTAYLDPLAGRNLLGMIKRINIELGTTIIIVEHHLEEVYGMSDKVVAMGKAQIHHVGTPKGVAKELGFRAGLPSSLLIAKEVDDGCSDLPLTVSEGQRWIAKRFEGVCLDEYNEKMVSKEFDDSFSGLSINKELIKLKDISFSYDNTKVVLEDCNLSVHEGEIFALLGGNGTGKSTLLQIICQTLKQSFGNIWIFGKKVNGNKNVPLGNEAMVFMPQDAMALFTAITVEEELMEALEGTSVDIHKKRELVSDMLLKIDLTGYDKYHPYDLSSGQQQMLALGKLLLLNPKIILMDEPTKGLDYNRKIEIGNMIKHLSEQGITILLVSHDIEFCARFANRCGLMHNGRIVAIDRTREFFSGNKFFTTASNRIARRFIPKAILPEEVITFCKEEM